MNESLLGRVPLFASLPPSEIHHLAATLRRVAVVPETILFHEGEAGHRFYIVLDGQVEIIKALGTAHERLLSVRGPGDFLGEMSLLSADGLRTATARVRSPAELIEMTRVDFDALLHRQPGLAYEMVRVLSRRLREADNATIRDLQDKNRQLTQAYEELQAAQAQLIEHERLERERQVAQARIEHELRIARVIQHTLLPKQTPALPGWEFTAYYQPARAVGGDFYDFLSLSDGRLGLVIGDVTDKGVPAALVMATTRSILRGVAQQVIAPGEVLARANDLLCPDMPPKMFVTCLYAILDPTSGYIRYANAGHDLPYRRTGEGVDELRATGMPLGLMPGMRYEEKDVVLAPGETVLLYSDGLVEAHSPEREMFSFPRLRALMNEYCVPGGGPLIECLLAELARFTGAAWEQEDDITLVSLRRSPGEVARA